MRLSREPLEAAFTWPVNSCEEVEKVYESCM